MADIFPKIKFRNEYYLYTQKVLDTLGCIKGIMREYSILKDTIAN